MDKAMDGMHKVRITIRGAGVDPEPADASRLTKFSDKSRKQIDEILSLLDIFLCIP
jgi:hypothetical protein